MFRLGPSEYDLNFCNRNVFVLVEFYIIFYTGFYLL